LSTEARRAVARYFLTGLKIEGFRGINNENQAVSLTFAVDRVNSIFAANGIGKSSIFDALQFALSGRIARLGRLQSAENPDGYVSNLFHSKSRATVELELTSDDPTPAVVTIRVVRNADGKTIVSSPSGHRDPRALLNDLIGSIHFLTIGHSKSLSKIVRLTEEDLSLPYSACPSTRRRGDPCRLPAIREF
jgi:recombinational DNA repair ATPase RecF